MSQIPTTQMTLAQHVRAVLVLSLPLMGGHLAQFAIGLTDSVMLGWYSVEALAAVTLAGSFFFLLFTEATAIAQQDTPKIIAGFPTALIR